MVCNVNVCTPLQTQGIWRSGSSALHKSRKEKHRINLRWYWSYGHMPDRLNHRCLVNQYRLTFLLPTLADDCTQVASIIKENTQGLYGLKKHVQVDTFFNNPFSFEDPFECWMFTIFWTESEKPGRQHKCNRTLIAFWRISPFSRCSRFRSGKTLWDGLD